MKFFLLISCFIALSYAGTNEVIDALVDSFKKAGIQCKLEVGATDDDIATMKAHEIPTSTTGKCFIACVHKKLDFMTADGKFNKDAGYKFIAKLKDIDSELHGKFLKMADTCYAEVEELSDDCETATNMLVCIEREKEVNGIPHFDL